MNQCTRFVDSSLNGDQAKIAYVGEEADKILEAARLTPGSISLRDYVASVLARTHANLEHMDWIAHRADKK